MPEVVVVPKLRDRGGAGARRGVQLDGHAWLGAIFLRGWC